MAYNIYDTQDDYVGRTDLDPHTLEVNDNAEGETVIQEVNGYGHGFIANISAHSGLVELNLAHLLDGEMSEDGEETVGITMTPEAALVLAEALTDFASFTTTTVV